MLSAKTVAGVASIILKASDQGPLGRPDGCDDRRQLQNSREKTLGLTRRKAVRILLSFVDSLLRAVVSYSESDGLFWGFNGWAVRAGPIFPGILVFRLYRVSTPGGGRFGVASLFVQEGCCRWLLFSLVQQLVCFGGWLPLREREAFFRDHVTRQAAVESCR